MCPHCIDSLSFPLQVQAYKNGLIKKAENLIVIEFPQKIVKLNELLETERFFKEKNLKEVYQDLNIPVPAAVVLDGADGNAVEPGTKRARVEVDNVTGTKVMALPTGIVKCNAYITDLIEIVKPIIRELVEDSNLLKMWISFLIPKIEDGNNFGVSIQEDTLAEIQSVESEAAAFFDQISRYFISRAKVVSKVAKYPHIADYRRAVQELDEKEFLSLWLVVSEVSTFVALLRKLASKVTFLLGEKSLLLPP